ncbi:hypothetical protein U9M48_041434 [Paspalum notatum var. saurae]|uniref:ATP-dependent DNA helicase n=1 Tax=Paspalum notatum var. saurae TaxID=547442 RepID=A0AAQ3UT49_PASNO
MRSASPTPPGRHRAAAQSCPGAPQQRHLRAGCKRATASDSPRGLRAANAADAPAAAVAEPRAPEARGLPAADAPRPNRPEASAPPNAAEPRAPEARGLRAAEEPPPRPRPRPSYERRRPRTPRRRSPEASAPSAPPTCPPRPRYTHRGQRHHRVRLAGRGLRAADAPAASQPPAPETRPAAARHSRGLRALTTLLSMGERKTNSGRTPFADIANNIGGHQDEQNVLTPIIDAKERKRQRDRERYAAMSKEKRDEKIRSVVKHVSETKDDRCLGLPQQLRINQTSKAVNIEESVDMATGSDNCSIVEFTNLSTDELADDLMQSHTINMTPNVIASEHKRQMDIEMSSIFQESSEINKKRREPSTGDVQEDMDPDDNSDWLHQNETYLTKHMKTSEDLLTPGDDDEGVVFEEDSDEDEGYLFAGQDDETDEDIEIDQTPDDFATIPEVPDQYDKVYSNIPQETHMLKPVPNCMHYNAVKFEHEPPGFCCRNGKIKLSQQTTSDELVRLWSSADADARHFRDNIRFFNGHFSFTSLYCWLDKMTTNMKDCGIYTFRAHGMLYHNIKSFGREADAEHKHLELYFYDDDPSLEHRYRRCRKERLEKDKEVIDHLVRILRGNPYSEHLRSMGHVENLDDYHIELNLDQKLDQKTYNTPVTSEVAAVWVEGSERRGQFSKSVMLHGKDRSSHGIRSYHGCYDALSYPLFFPKGELGWHANIPKADVTMAEVEEYRATHRKRDQNDDDEPDSPSHLCVSVRDYYCYKFQMRPGIFNPILHGKRLFQQFAVDTYIKIESSRLDYIRNNQERLRADLYQGLVDSLHAGEAKADAVGKRTVLATSFLGGPRGMRRRYMDAMALVRKYGKPDIFLTMTCNPNWDEIKRELLPWQTPQDRPDLVVRVFHAKLEELKKKLTKEDILGKVRAYVYVVEFQKRGLPHAHFLLIMQNKYKLTCPEQYDLLISAEIPDKKKYPQLHKMVIKHMMHGPCGMLNPYCPCMKGRRTCKNHYPRPFSDTTLQGKDSYPIYRRRENGRKDPVRGHELDNRWVVPYNPYLLRLFNCHINVEACGSIKAVKYLFKYIYKGHDRASVAVREGNKADSDVDEIKQYRDARWVTPPEALWRIYGFDLSRNSPPVMQLQLHLPNMHMVSFHERQNIKRVVNRPGADRSMLIAYFEANREHKDARGILYRDFPNITLGSGVKCGGGGNEIRVDRLEESSRPSGRGERYYLRVLLNHVAGATSFEDDDGRCFTKQSGTAKLLRKASLIIWDEASMTKRQAVEALDNSLRDIMDRPRLPFGGKTMVFGGDFRQVLPVIRKGTRFQIVAASLRKSYIWESMTHLKLVHNMRAQSDPWFAEYLLRIRDGTEETNSGGEIRLPDEVCVPYTGSDIDLDGLIDCIFPRLDENMSNTSYITSRAILSTRNDWVDIINMRMIGHFQGDQMVYHSFDSAVDDPHNYYPPEFLNTLTPNGLPPHILKLKIGCPIILLSNIDPANGLCNGTRLVVRGFQRNSIDVEIVLGQHAGKRIFLPRIPLCPSDDEMFPFQFKRKQFPVRLSFAMTVNKAQGQTIPNVGVYLPEPVFSHGQLYVALSRATARSNIKILAIPAIDGDDKKKNKNNKKKKQEENSFTISDGIYTKNIVYKEVLTP